MSLKTWEEKVLSVERAAKRVAEIEDELRLAAGLTALRERAGVTQRELADHMGVSQPRIVAIEKSRNVTIGVLDAYVRALGGRLEVSVVRAGRRTRLLGEDAEVVLAELSKSAAGGTPSSGRPSNREGTAKSRSRRSGGIYSGRS